MIDLVQLQNDLFGLLMSAPALNTVNILRERTMITKSEIELDAIWQNVRNGRSGNGVLIEEIKAVVNSPNVTGPAQDFACGFVCFQNGDAAFTPESGSGFYAQNLAQMVLDILHRQNIAGVGTLQGVGTAPAKDFDFINATRVTLKIIGSANAQTPRCTPVIITNNAGSVTLTNATTDSSIFYTLDGSTPMDPTLTEIISGEIINPNATLYTAPFAVVSGQRLRAVAQAFGFNACEITNYLVP
ncbi:MAG: hypothetical protein HOP33_08995 [Verrucomicrobia bacterium]|nr:hypothetical protein [Verrucomicrobiota bacterium]